MSPAPCWLAKVRMIPPCVPQVVRLDSKDFHLLNNLTPQSQWPWTHYVQQADSEFVSIMILWPIHFCLLSAVLGYSCEPPHTAGKYTNHYWLQFTFYKTWLQGRWCSSAGPACTKFWVCSPTPNKGEGRIRSQGCRPCEPSLSCVRACLRACLCTFTRVFS